MTGLGLGWLTATAVNAVSEGGGTVLFLVTPRLAIGAVAFAVILGVGSGFYLRRRSTQTRLRFALRMRGESQPEKKTRDHTGEPDAKYSRKAMISVKDMVSARGLEKRYELGKNNYVDALRGATLDVTAGEMVAIMGPSGCGKSTLLHTLGCLDSPDSGEVWLNGRRIDRLSARATTKVLREEIGFIFQGFNLVQSMTAAENVALAAEYAGKSRREARELARKALDRVGLAGRADHRPTELSGGQQQRVAVARALVNNPVVILGDEPTGNLDSTSSAEVIEMMRRINLTTGTTFILVTHDPDVAEACDRVIYMRDGEVVHNEALPACGRSRAPRERGVKTTAWQPRGGGHGPARTCGYPLMIVNATGGDNPICPGGCMHGQHRATEGRMTDLELHGVLSQARDLGVSIVALGR